MYEIFNYKFAEVEIFDRRMDEQTIRFMAVGSGQQSATYTAPKKRFEMMFAYMFGFDDTVKNTQGCRDVLLMGGGGFSYPKYFLSAYPDKNMDVIELYGEMHELARKYFYLDEAVQKFDPEGKRLNVIYGDAYKYLKTCGKKYDVILNDTYHGDKAPRAMYAHRTLRDAAGLLTPNGAYAVNVFCMDNDPAKQGEIMRKALEKHFCETCVIMDEINEVSKVVRNCVVVGRSPIR